MCLPFHCHPLHSIPQSVFGSAHSCVFVSVRSETKGRHAVQQVQTSTCIRKAMKKWKWSNLFKHVGRQLLGWRQMMISDSISSDVNVCSWLSWTESCSLSAGDFKVSHISTLLGNITCLGTYTCIICYMLLVREFITYTLPVYGTNGI